MLFRSPEGDASRSPRWEAPALSLNTRERNPPEATYETLLIRTSFPGSVSLSGEGWLAQPSPERRCEDSARAFATRQASRFELLKTCGQCGERERRRAFRFFVMVGAGRPSTSFFRRTRKQKHVDAPPKAGHDVKGKCKSAGTAHCGETAAIPARDRKSTRLNSSHSQQSRMPSSA